jgi:hypothetical protein
MKSHVPPVVALSIAALALAGCGGRPSNFQPSAKAATPVPNPAPSSATSTGTGSGTSSSSSSNTPAAAPAPAASASSLPTPPANAIVYDQIQNTTDNWKTCSICAEGTNDSTNYWMAPFQTSPSRTGSSREFFIGGPKWSNALFIKTIFANYTTEHFLWDFWVRWDDTSMANIWTAEFDFFQVFGGKEFMIGSQCNFGDGYWDIWDQKANKWLHSDIRCQRMAPNTWHHVQWWTERDDSTYRYNTLVVDGTAYAINRTFSVSSSTWPDEMGVQWQLDKSSTGVDIHEWIDDVKLTVW